MASNLFGRYVWLIDTLRRYGRLTFEEINDYWKESCLSYGDSDNIPKRTFHKHCAAVLDIFGVEIKCDTKGGYQYYIDSPEDLESDAFRCWLIDSYATLNQLQADGKLKNRIQFDDIPSGQTYLSALLEAMRKSIVVEITYKRFDKGFPGTYEIEPYFVKVFNRRWYVIAKASYCNKVLTYGLDRIQEMKYTDKHFEMPEDFSIEKFFEGCCGILNNEDIPIEKVTIKAYDYAQNYIATLPIHFSQQQTAQDEKSTTFVYHVRPTYDFIQALLGQGEQIEVLGPESVKKEMKRIAENILSYYKKDKR